MTLIELVVAIVVVSISLGGTLMLVDTTTRRSADPMLERQAISIAESYLEEILQKRYLDPDTGTLCPAAEPARRLYDNVCDYQALDELGARDQNGSLVAGLDGYRVEIDIDLSAQLGTLSGSAEVLRVDAVVTDPTARIVRVSAYRAAP
jgi:MSHA pilin protein MshD